MEEILGSCVPLSLFSVQSSFFLSHHIPYLTLAHKRGAAPNSQ